MGKEENTLARNAPNPLKKAEKGSMPTAKNATLIMFEIAARLVLPPFVIRIIIYFN